MLNLSLPEQIQAFVEEQASASGFDTASEYVYHLILQEQNRIAHQAKVEALLVEGLESGESIEVTEDCWDRKRSQLIEQFYQTSE